MVRVERKNDATMMRLFNRREIITGPRRMEDSERSFFIIIIMLRYLQAQADASFICACA